MVGSVAMSHQYQLADAFALPGKSPDVIEHLIHALWLNHIIQTGIGSYCIPHPLFVFLVILKKDSNVDYPFATFHDYSSCALPDPIIGTTVIPNL